MDSKIRGPRQKEIVIEVRGHDPIVPNPDRVPGTGTMNQLTMTYEPKLTDDQRRVWDIVRRRQGRAAAIPMPDVARLAFGDETQTRRVQDTIHELVVNRYPVGSSCGKPNGYYRIENLDDLLHTRTQNKNRAIKVFQRDRAYEILELELRGQQSLGANS